MRKAYRHFLTIIRHKWYVFWACVKVGLVWQGLIHDLSKFGVAEFLPSARFFQGDKSPVEVERTRKGFSLAWNHHKGRNPHHWEYWVDFRNGQPFPGRMPAKYLSEMLCDWVGASKAYNVHLPSGWTLDTMKDWYSKNKHKQILHPHTQAYIVQTIELANSEADIYRMAHPSEIRIAYAVMGEKEEK